jgi:hypothetical protein
MDGLHSYLELVENGRSMSEPAQPAAARRPLMLLLERARREDMLPVEGAWRLDSRVCRALEREHEMSPPGGWAGLAGLACGCGVLRARREAFEPDMAPAELAQWDEADVRKRLVEAFCRLLVPPATAAGLFIVLGLHPAWGLRVAHAAHTRGRSDLSGRPPSGIEPGWRDETLFPQQTADRVEETVFSAIATVVTSLRKLSPDCRYPVDALASLVHQACRFARETAEEGFDEAVEPGLSPFLGDSQGAAGPRNFRTLDFVTVDLLDSLLVPACVARRFDDGTFCVFEGALDGVRVGPWEADEQEVKLTWMLAGERGCMVA